MAPRGTNSFRLHNWFQFLFSPRVRTSFIRYICRRTHVRWSHQPPTRTASRQLFFLPPSPIHSRPPGQLTWVAGAEEATGAATVAALLLPPEPPCSTCRSRSCGVVRCEAVSSGGGGIIIQLYCRFSTGIL